MQREEPAGIGERKRETWIVLDEAEAGRCTTK